MELRRLDDIYSDRYIISIDHIEFGNVLAVTYDDSSISFFEPKTMVKFNGVDDTNTVTSMVQAGFQFPLDASGSQSAPDFSS
jgi:mediator of RNA polymerase II transcription subunit 16